MFSTQNIDTYDKLIANSAILLDNGHCREALELINQALSINPYDALANYNAGLAFHSIEKYRQAIVHYQLAIRYHPKFIEAHHNLAQAYAAQNQYPPAIKAYRMALDLNSFDFKSAYNLSLLYRNLGNVRQSIAACESAIRAKPDFAEAFAILGLIYQEQGKFDESLVCLDQALRIKPDLTQAHYNKGISLKKTGEYEQSLVQFQRAMTCDITFAPAHWLYRLSLPMIYDTAEQIGRYRHRFQSNLNHLIQSTPLQDRKQKKFALRGIQTTTNFLLQYQNRNDLKLQKKYGRFVHMVMAANYRRWVGAKVMPALSPGDPIRIGYVSTFMHNHTIGTFLSGWLKNHSRNDFKIHSYHMGKKVDAMTDQLRSHSHHFHNFAGSMERAARQIEKDQLHILVYTDIGMDPITTQLAALRLAPIQCKGWGHPVTTGLPTMDYYLSSDLMEPENAVEHYSETLVRLPNLALSYERPDLPKYPKKREALGIPADRFVYLSTQSIFKYLPQHDDIYPRIALKVPRSCFVFIRNQSDSATRRFRKRLTSAFKRYGLNADRYCRFSPRLKFVDFLSLNLSADVLLDSMEWSGGKTTLEALSCGLPVVTCPGRFMRGRHAYAMLRMIQVPDTIADNKSTYCALASRLANDRTYYRNIKRKVITNRHHLYDDQIFITALEKFYKSAVFQHLDQQPVA